MGVTLPLITDPLHFPHSVRWIAVQVTLLTPIVERSFEIEFS